MQQKERWSWADVRGPLSALKLTLERVGWRIKNPFEIEDDGGRSITLTKVAPQVVRQLVRAGVRRWQGKKILSALGQAGAGELWL
eukprot:4690943-Lingulodinium_polyedra.AAC.1